MGMWQIKGQMIRISYADIQGCEVRFSPSQRNSITCKYSCPLLILPLLQTVGYQNLKVCFKEHL